MSPLQSRLDEEPATRHQQHSRNNNVSHILRPTTSPSGTPNQSTDVSRQPHTQEAPPSQDRSTHTTSHSQTPPINIVQSTMSNGRYQTTLTAHDTNLPTGDNLSEIKRANTLRIYYQNINGIKKNNWADWINAGKYLQQQHIDIVGCAETNINWTQQNRKWAQYLLQQTTKQANLSTSSSSEAGIGDYLPGGVVNAIIGKWTGRSIETIQDESGLGRWAGHVLLGRNNTHLVVITAYRPTKAPGYNTSYQQQWRILRSKQHEDPDPRKRILRDLTMTIKQWTSQQYEVILLWDANEGIHNPKSQLIDFMTKTNLSPAHLQFPSASHTRGSQCIDFIMTTPGVREAISQAGYLPFYTGAWASDHRGVYIDIDIHKLFQDSSPNPYLRTTRNLNSNNKRQVFNFITSLNRSNSIPTLHDAIHELAQKPHLSDDDHVKTDSSVKFFREIEDDETHG
jgi:hypothetical protein